MNSDIVSNLFSHSQQEYCDVTLACDDGSLIEAHKVILSAGSQLFREILKKSKHPSPFIYLKGISKANLDNILDFLLQWSGQYSSGGSKQVPGNSAGATSKGAAKQTGKCREPETKI